MFVPESFEAQILIKVSKDQIKETAERSIIETSKCSFTHKHSISDDIRFDVTDVCSGLLNTNNDKFSPFILTYFASLLRIKLLPFHTNCIYLLNLL